MAGVNGCCHSLDMVSRNAMCRRDLRMVEHDMLHADNRIE